MSDSLFESENILQLVKRNYFAGTDEEVEKQIANLINEKCLNKSLSDCINETLEQIDIALNSTYVKDVKSSYEETKSRYHDMKEEITRLTKIKDSVPMSFIEEMRYKFQEITEVEKKVEAFNKSENLNQIISCIESSILLYDLNLASEEISNFLNEINEGEFRKFDLYLTNFENFYNAYDIVKNELTNKFNHYLEQIHWPYVTSSLERVSIEQYYDDIDVNSEELSTLFIQLQKIELPKCLLREIDIKNNMIPKNVTNKEEAYIIWPVQLLLKKLIQYFIHYFFKDSKVNKLNKPEFYLNQLVSWITIHNPVIVRIFNVNSDVNLEFMRGLVLLVSEKVCLDLKAACEQDKLFSVPFTIRGRGSIAERPINISEKSSHGSNRPLESESILYHLIEEIMTTNMELLRWDYPNNFPQLSDPLLNNKPPTLVFRHWLSVEKRMASRQLDELFCSNSLWRPISKLTIKVECLVRFSTIISGIKKRIISCQFRSPFIQSISSISLATSLYEDKNDDILTFKNDDDNGVDKGSNDDEDDDIDDCNKIWQLCEVLLDVITDFRLRVVQVSKETIVGEKRYADIMNVLYGLSILMEGWRFDPIFSTVSKYLKLNKPQIWSELSSSSSTNVCIIPTNLFPTSSTIFSQEISLTKHCLSKLEIAWVHTVCDDVSTRLQECCRVSSNKGVFLTNSVNQTSFASSTSLLGAEPLLVLRDRLHALNSTLELGVFSKMLQQIGKKLDATLLSRIIRQYRYSDSGARIMAKEIVGNIIATFLPYMKTPEILFPESSEASLLLTLSWGTVILLREVLRNAYSTPSGSLGNESTSVQSNPPKIAPITALQEVGVKNTEPQLALSILEQRVDPNLFQKH